MFGKYLIAGLSAGLLLTGEVQAHYLVLSDDSTDQGLPDGVSDFVPGFEGLDAPIVIAEELTGDARNVMIPFEFAVVPYAVDDWDGYMNLEIQIVNAIHRDISEYISTEVFEGNFTKIGDCSAYIDKKTGKRYQNVVADSGFDYDLQGLDTCDDVVPEPNGEDGPTAADVLASEGIAFGIPLIYYEDGPLGIYASLQPEGGWGAHFEEFTSDSGGKWDGILASRALSFNFEHNAKQVATTPLSNYNVLEDGASGDARIGDVHITETGALKPDLRTPVTASDLASASLTLSFEDMSGLDPANFRLVNEADDVSLFGTQNENGTDITFDVLDNIGQKFDVYIVTDDDASTPLQPQDITLSMELDFISEDFADQQKSYAFGSIAYEDHGFNLEYNGKEVATTIKLMYNALNDLVVGDVQITSVGRLVTPSDLASASLTLSFEDMSGLDPANFRLVNEADDVSLFGTQNENGTDITFDVLDNIGQKFDVYIVTDDDASTPLQPQDITLSMELGFLDSDFVVNESYEFGSITRETGLATYGPFKWVGDSDKGALSVFRFTNVSDPPPGMLMFVENTTNPIDDVLVPFTFPRGVVNGEAVVSSHQLTKAIGKFGRADISFIFDTDDPITVRRVFITPSGSISEMSTDYTVGGVSVE